MFLMSLMNRCMAVSGPILQKLADVCAEAISGSGNRSSVVLRAATGVTRIPFSCIGDGPADGSVPCSSTKSASMSELIKN